MSGIGGRLVVMDPSLADFRGHHFMLTDLASRAAVAAGMEAIWLISASAESLDRDDATVKPWFADGMYDAYKNAFASKPSLFQRIIRKLTGGSKPACKAGSGLRADLLRALTEATDGDPARFFIHTADGVLYRALAGLADEIADANVVWHVCTPYDPAGVMPNIAPEGSVNAAVEVLKNTGLLDRKIFLYGENPYLAAHLSDLWGAPVRTLEIPVGGDAGARNESAKALRAKIGADEDTLVISSLGPARVEKGFHLIPDIIAAYQAQIADHAESAGRVRFALHAAPQIVGRDPLVAEAIARIRAEAGDAVVIFDETMSNAEYRALLGASDAVLMPYDVDQYRVRGSGVVAEALASGKIMIASEGSYPAKRLVDGAGLAASSPEQYAQAFRHIAAEKKDFAHRAVKAAQDYAAANAVDDYMKKLTAAEREAGIAL